MVTDWAWIPTRAVSGFCFAGAAMIVESWLSDRADARTRGTIFGIYTMVNLAAATAGQLVISLGDTTGFLFFALGAMVYCLALVPTALSTSAAPAPLTEVRLNLPALWRNSPVAVGAVLLVGVSNGAFGTLAAVYGERIGLPIATIALFASIPILAGALAQLPVGWISDRTDRRWVLVGIAGVALLTDLAFVIAAPAGDMANLVLVGLLGAAIFSMYPVIIAHANDHAPPGTAIQVSGGLLLVFGMGAILGPLVAGAVMQGIGPQGLFMTMVVAHLAIIGFAVWRILQRAAPPEEDKVAFQISVPARSATPETAALGAGEEEALPFDGPDADTAEGRG